MTPFEISITETTRLVVNKDRMTVENASNDAMGNPKWIEHEEVRNPHFAFILAQLHHLYSFVRSSKFPSATCGICGCPLSHAPRLCDHCASVVQTSPPLPDPRTQDIHPHTESWVPTFTGRRIQPFALKPEDVCIDDIAHHLSQIARFGGATKKFYSVAQHSVLASTIEGSCIKKLACLLHDAGEYLIGDLTTPMKAAYGRIRDIESTIHSTIIKALLGDTARYILGSAMIETEVKWADEIMLATEVRDLLRTTPEWWRPYLPKAPMLTTIEPWTPERAQGEFLGRFNCLMLELPQ